MDIGQHSSSLISLYTFFHPNSNPLFSKMRFTLATITLLLPVLTMGAVIPNITTIAHPLEKRGGQVLYLANCYRNKSNGKWTDTPPPTPHGTKTSIILKTNNLRTRSPPSTGTGLPTETTYIGKAKPKSWSSRPLAPSSRHTSTTVRTVRRSSRLRGKCLGRAMDTTSIAIGIINGSCLIWFRMMDRIGIFIVGRSTTASR